MGLIELGDTVTWRVEGRDPISFAFRPTARRWTPPVPPFHRLAEVAARVEGERA